VFRNAPAFAPGKLQIVGDVNTSPKQRDQKSAVRERSKSCHTDSEAPPPKNRNGLRLHFLIFGQMVAIEKNSQSDSTREPERTREGYAKLPCTILSCPTVGSILSQIGGFHSVALWCNG
jgi:hypothetical protein